MPTRSRPRGGRSRILLAISTKAPPSLIAHLCSIPNLAEAWSFGGWVKLWLGEPETAIERFARAMRLSPLDPWVPGMRAGTAHAHFFLGRYDEAASWAAIALLHNPDHQPALRIGAASNAMAGRLEQAQKAVVRLKQLYPTLRVSSLKTVLGPCLVRKTLTIRGSIAASRAARITIAAGARPLPRKVTWWAGDWYAYKTITPSQTCARHLIFRSYGGPCPSSP